MNTLYRYIKKLILFRNLIALIICFFLIYGYPLMGQDKPVAGVNIHLAALIGDTVQVIKYLSNGGDPDRMDQYGSTPLIVATTFEKERVVKILLEFGANPDLSNFDGSTALHIAAFLGRIECAKILVNSLADRYVRNNNGATALDIVLSQAEHDEMIVNKLQSGLASLGLKLNYEKILVARPAIAKILIPEESEFGDIIFKPKEGSWEISTPDEVGLDVNLIKEMFYDANHTQNIRSLLIVKDGKLIAERYFNGGSSDHLSLLQSVTKSFTSALVGIALERGCLNDIDAKMLDFFPEMSPNIQDARKFDINIRHLLQMRGGFPWEELDSANWAKLLSGKYLSEIVELPLVNDPGIGFNYSNLTSNWLGIILSRACTQDLGSFAKENLFSKLNIEEWQWKKDWDGYNIGSAELSIKPRDMAKFGLLYLQNGKYEGAQIIPEDWIDQSLQSYSDDAWITSARSNELGRYFRQLGYGYQWWSALVGERRIDFAWGHGGQLIVLLHDLNMVVVSTADPQYLQHNSESWKQEQSIINIVGKFIYMLSQEED